MEVLKDKILIASKEHKCTWCGEQIEKGEAYHYYTGIHDGHFQTTHLHIECSDELAEKASYWGEDYEFAPYMNDRPEVDGCEVGT